MKLTRILFLSIATAASFSLTSCLDDDNDPADIRPGFLSFINAMPDTSALDFYVTGYNAAINPETDLLGDAPLSFTRRYPSSSYVQATPYTYVLTVAYPQGDSILEQGRIDVVEDRYYSVYVYSTADSVKGMLRVDDLETPAAGMAKVRFINLGTEAPEVDLVPEGETTAWFSEIDFEETSEEYKEVEAGSYMLQVKDSSTDEVLVSGSVQLDNSKVYTLWVRGIPEGTGAKALGLESIEHEEVEAPPAP